MRQHGYSRSLVATLVVIGWALVLAPMAAAQTTTTEVKSFEVVSVDGNHLVLRGADGATREFTVPDGFRFAVGGKDVGVSELKPGMKGTATITTTTTSRPVTVTEVRNGEVYQASGGMVIVRGPKGFHSFTQADVDKRHAKIYRDGKPISIADLSTGDRLTATIVTERPPEILTDRQVKASISEVARASAPASSPAAASAPAAASQQVAQATPPPRTLPKTASPLPLTALVGFVALALGAGLTLRRRAAR